MSLCPFIEEEIEAQMGQRNAEGIWLVHATQKQARIMAISIVLPLEDELMLSFWIRTNVGKKWKNLLLKYLATLGSCPN